MGFRQWVEIIEGEENAVEYWLNILTELLEYLAESFGTMGCYSEERACKNAVVKMPRKGWMADNIYLHANDVDKIEKLLWNGIDSYAKCVSLQSAFVLVGRICCEMKNRDYVELIIDIIIVFRRKIQLQEIIKRFDKLLSTQVYQYFQNINPRFGQIIQSIAEETYKATTTNKCVSAVYNRQINDNINMILSGLRNSKTDEVIACIKNITVNYGVGSQQISKLVDELGFQA